jgi:hypothetical protein
MSISEHAQWTTPLELDDAVTAWHEGAGADIDLHDYLGLTWEEYSAWIESGTYPKGTS